MTPVVCRAGTTSLHVIGNGSSRLAGVHLGRKYTFRDRRVLPYGIQETVVTGPVLPGEVVRAKIRVVCRHPLLTGRLLDPDGSPVVDGEVTSHRVVQQKDGAYRGATDGHRAIPSGRFLVPIREDTSYRKLRIQWRIKDRLMGWAERSLYGRYARSLHQLGAIRLRRAAFLAAGRVRAASAGRTRR